MAAKHISVLVVLLLLFCTCDYYDIRLQIKNNSNYSIAYFCSLDTLIEFNGEESIQFLISNQVTPGDFGTRPKPGSTQAWTFFIQNSKNKKLNVFFVRIDTLEKYNDWGIIKKNRLYKKYSFSEEELNRIDWTIGYP